MDFDRARKEVSGRFRTIQELTTELIGAYRRDPKGAQFKRIKKQLENMGCTVRVVNGEIRVDA